MLSFSSDASKAMEKLEHDFDELRKRDKQSQITIKDLREQLEKKETEIEELKEQLEQSNAQTQAISETNNRRGTLLVNTLTALRHQHELNRRTHVRLWLV